MAFLTFRIKKLNPSDNYGIHNSKAYHVDRFDFTEEEETTLGDLKLRVPNSQNISNLRLIQ